MAEDYCGLSFETEDLIIKKAALSDKDEIYRNLWRHSESARYMLWDVTDSEEEAVDRIGRTIAFQKSRKYAFFIYEKSTGKAIGCAGMMEVSPGVYEDTGVALGPEYTGKGYGRQIVDAFVKEAAANGAHKFIVSCREQNAASRKLIRKCGFVFSHKEERTDPRDGSPYVLEFYEKSFI